MFSTLSVRYLPLACVCFLALAGTSCSSKPKHDLVPVHGKVLYKDQPADGVLLIFLPPNESDTKSTRPIARTNADGTFEVITDEEQGAPVGDYIVTMQWLKAPSAPKKLEPGSMMLGAEPVDALKGKYIERRNGFKIKVEKGKPDLEPFNLK